MSENIRWITRMALGVALFVVLSLCLQVPVFENYYLCLGYVAVAVYCYSFGPVSGTIVAVAELDIRSRLLGSVIAHDDDRL